MARPAWLYTPPNDPQLVKECLLSTPVHYKRNTSYTWYLFDTQPALPKLLIAQYVGGRNYEPMLAATSPVNLAYAQKWSADVVLLRGTAMEFPRIAETCSNNEARSTFNKIPLLELAQQQRDRYDFVLILDTDTMIVNFDFFLPNLLLSNGVATNNNLSVPLLAAHRVWHSDWKNTWDINAGITLWNLHHPQLPTLWEDWKKSVLADPTNVLTHNDDQFFLQ